MQSKQVNVLSFDILPRDKFAQRFANCLHNKVSKYDCFSNRIVERERVERQWEYHTIISNSRMIQRITLCDIQWMNTLSIESFGNFAPAKNICYNKLFHFCYIINIQMMMTIFALALNVYIIKMWRTLITLSAFHFHRSMTARTGRRKGDGVLPKLPAIFHEILYIFFSSESRFISTFYFDISVHLNNQNFNRYHLKNAPESTFQLTVFKRNVFVICAL